jgi:dihydrofolate synthase/folylpolyglutamate synthase
MSIVNPKSDYDSALDYLYSFVDYSLTKQLRYSPEKFNLQRMRDLMDMMGNPHQQYPVVHVAGTKGKGSTSVMIAAVLQKAGYKVGLYTSPHLHDYCERIQVNQVPISHQDLVSQVNSIRPAVAAVPEITTFEITTAIGFQYFAEQKVDIAIVEVGLGGRLDATNVVTPIISVITSLSYDHMNILGDTIVKIAIEKAGIIKKNIPVVIAPQGFPEVNEILAEIAEKNHSKVTFVNEEYVYSSKSHSLEGQLFSLTKINFDELKPAEYTISLLGYHQVENAVTARAVIDVIRTKEFQISDDDVVAGFRSASWPCRFEIIIRKPLIIVDSAHNVDSAMKLQATIKDYLKNENVTLIFGASEDKDIRGMFEVLFPVVDDIIVTKSIHPRAFEPEDLAGIASQLQRGAKITSSIEEALELIGGKSASDVVLITGSIFVAAGAKEILTQGKSQEKI